MLGTVESPRVLLIIDQLEEWHARAAGEETEHLVQEIGEACRCSQARLLLLAMLRSDSLQEFLSSAHLAPFVEDTVIPLGPLRREDVREAIIGPLEMADVEVSEGLVRRLIEEFTGGSDIAFLQMLLIRLWQHVGECELTTLDEEHLEAIGGSFGPIWSVLQSVAPRLSKRERRRAVRAIEARLVSPDGTRMTADWDGFPASVRPTLETLVNARLLVTHRGEEGQRVVTLVHDVVATEWERVRAALR
jgi:hypothetical protein